MKIYKTQKEIEVDIKNDVLVVDGDVKFEVSFSISASLKIAGNITAWNINAWNINAWNINAWNINAWNINAWNINAWDINAWNINARDILYYAFCEVYNSIKCLSIKAKREKHNEPICLDGKLEIKDKTEILELTLEDVAEKFGKDVKDIKIKK